MKAYRLEEVSTGKGYDHKFRKVWSVGRLWGKLDDMLNSLRHKWGWRVDRSTDIVEYEMVEVRRIQLRSIHTFQELKDLIKEVKRHDRTQRVLDSFVPPPEKPTNGHTQTPPIKH